MSHNFTIDQSVLKWAKFGLSERKNMKELSEGMKVKFALALSHGANLLIMFVRVFLTTISCKISMKNFVKQISDGHFLKQSCNNCTPPKNNLIGYKPTFVTYGDKTYNITSICKATLLSSNFSFNTVCLLPVCTPILPSPPPSKKSLTVAQIAASVAPKAQLCHSVIFAFTKKERRRLDPFLYKAKFSLQQFVAAFFCPALPSRFPKNASILVDL